MAQGSSVYAGDVIEDALTIPMDWGKLEALAHEVLLSDDFPSLRKIGGSGDQGMDAVDEVFFDGNRKVMTVVQVTSAQGQRAKVQDTIRKLKKNGIEAKSLVLLTRHPVMAATKKEMIDQADAQGVSLDIRDQSYLVAQLGKHQQIFKRHFAGKGAQFRALLGTPDPLGTATDKLQHALLATLGAYVLHEHSKLARSTLFDKTVLAALAASQDGSATREDLLVGVQTLLPAEEAISTQQLEAAIDRLLKAGDVVSKERELSCSEPVMIRCLASASKAKAGFEQLFNHLLQECSKVSKLSDATQGYLERNLRRSIVHLIRASGPLKTAEDEVLSFDVGASDAVRDVLSLDLPVDVGQVALVAFSSFVADPASAPLLAPLVKSYAALAMRNLDPIGRRWQQLVLSRSVVALDTDVLLSLIVEELPEHGAALNAVKSLQAEGVEIVVPDHVFSEAVGHLGRASKTYKRFADRLLRLPSQLVDARVWHAVVRGFYYAHRGGYAGDFDRFYAKYHNEQSPSEFTEYLLSKRLPKVKRRAMEEVNPRDLDDERGIQATVLEFRERARRKAQFREPLEMARRVRDDIAMALQLAAKSDDTIGAAAKGYVASSDRAFRMIEQHEMWKPRKPVHLWTSALPQLAYFACGATLAPSDAVEFVFNPVTVAAADLMADQIELLAQIGVDLKDVPLDRLDWDLRHGIGKRLSDLGEAAIAATTDDDAASAMATLRVAQAASNAGYAVIRPVQTLVQEFESTKGELEAERARRLQGEEQLRQLVAAVRETATTKGKRRINKLVRELGLSLDSDLDETDEPAA